MLGRAIRIMWAGRAKEPWWIRQASRRSRRARFRPTAPPTLRAEITPSRLAGGGGSDDQLRTRQPTARRFPEDFSRAKSPLRRIRRARPSANRRAEDAMPSHRGEALPAGAAAIGKDAAAGLGRHAGAEAMLAHATNLGGLILTLHRKLVPPPAEPATLSGARGASRRPADSDGSLVSYRGSVGWVRCGDGLFPGRPGRRAAVGGRHRMGVRGKNNRRTPGGSPGWEFLAGISGRAELTSWPPLPSSRSGGAPW